MKAFFLRHKKLHIWLLADLVLLAAFWLTRSSRAWMNGLAAYVSLPIQRALGRLCYRTDISIMEVVYVLAILLGLAYAAWSIAAVAREVRAVCSAAVNQAYFSRTPCLPSGMNESHLRDRTHITAEQKKAALRVFEHLRRLNEDTRRLMTESGSDELMTLARRSRESVDPQIQKIQSALTSGSISWGEYNRSRLEIFEASTGFTPGEH